LVIKTSPDSGAFLYAHLFERILLKYIQNHLKEQNFYVLRKKKAHKKTNASNLDKNEIKKLYIFILHI
jgi:hypothetical protein